MPNNKIHFIMIDFDLDEFDDFHFIDDPLFVINCDPDFSDLGIDPLLI